MSSIRLPRLLVSPPATSDSTERPSSGKLVKCSGKTPQQLINEAKNTLDEFKRPQSAPMTRSVVKLDPLPQPTLSSTTKPSPTRLVPVSSGAELFGWMKGMSQRIHEKPKRKQLKVNQSFSSLSRLTSGQTTTDSSTPDESCSPSSKSSLR